MLNFNFRLIAMASLIFLVGCGGGGGNRPPPLNTAPTLDAIGDQSTDANVASNVIDVTVGDTQTAAAALTLSAVADNPNLVTDASFSFAGSGATRSLVIQPNVDRIGSTNITVTVTDGGGLTDSATFILTVNALNLSFQQFVRSVFADDENATPRSINIAIFNQDAQGDNFADLLVQ